VLSGAAVDLLPYVRTLSRLSREPPPAKRGTIRTGNRAYRLERRDRRERKSKQNNSRIAATSEIIIWGPHRRVTRIIKINKVNNQVILYPPMAAPE